ncbi:MAG TPA: hypothetical protein VJ836_06025 [Candidatus Saccharimonadales bacterium]|nr:hypothetical protein [Candidatus Saccharimonadales bacterium]
MSEKPCPPGERDPELDIPFDPNQIRRLPSDSLEGPIVGFVRGYTDEMFAIVESCMTYDENDHMIDRHPYLIPRIYTRDEWEAFIGGASDGEFDSFLQEVNAF